MPIGHEKDDEDKDCQDCKGEGKSPKGDPKGGIWIPDVGQLKNISEEWLRDIYRKGIGDDGFGQLVQEEDRE